MKHIYLEIMEGLYGFAYSYRYLNCLQPRRIVAMSIAERVASERGEELGKSVGYQVGAPQVK